MVTFLKPAPTEVMLHDSLGVLRCGWQTAGDKDRHLGLNIVLVITGQVNAENMAAAAVIEVFHSSSTNVQL